MPEIFNPSSLKTAKPAASSNEAVPDAKPLVKSGGKIRKKSTGEAVASSFFVSTAKDVGQYILWDILIPNLKDVLYDMIDGTALMMLWGDESRHTKRIKQGGYNSSYNTSYTSYFKSDRDGKHPRRDSSQPARPGGTECYEDRYGFSFYWFDKEDAAKLYHGMIDYLDAYHEVPLDQAKRMANFDESEITFLDKQVGWRSLRELKITKKPGPDPHSYAVEVGPLERLD